MSAITMTKSFAACLAGRVTPYAPFGELNPKTEVELEFGQRRHNPAHFGIQVQPPSRFRFFQSSDGLKIPAGVMTPVIKSAGVTSKPGFRARLPGLAT